MRIPLDYYRILGLPIQASVEQLQQAYSDRTVQLPRHEYTDCAIAARKQIIEEAYAVLSHPEQRKRYDTSYFAHTYEPEQDTADGETETSSEQISEQSFEPHTPSIEISDEQFVGALVLLQELGEYELVLKLGRPYLNTSNAKSENEQKSQAAQVRSDIILTLVLACLELGREQWQQSQYENAAMSLQTGQDLLSREKLFQHVQEEIQTDLYKLRPYRILELLAHSEANSAERQQGLKLLQNILQERGGIDGTGNDGSGLEIDDFLRFIQQLRSYLTVVEQQSLFEAEIQRSSDVGIYLAVYALIARGFAQRMPLLIRQAKLLLIRLGKRQDLYLEQAICSLLLGQTEAASRALLLTQESEPLAFIQEHSQGAPDLLPGLCLYSESWLQTEVFPHFRDLAQQRASLKNYFADQQVQAYLEALPTEIEDTNELAIVAPQSLRENQVESNRAHADGESPSSQTITATINNTSGSVVMVSTGSDRTSTASTKSNATTLDQAPSSPKRSKRWTQKQVLGGSDDGVNTDDSLFERTFGKLLDPKVKRLVLLIIGGVLGIVVLGFLASQIYARFKQQQTPVKAPSLQGEQPLVQLDRPLLVIPDGNSKPLAENELLTQETAKEVIETWLSTKAAAFGSKRAVDGLDQILVAPALSQWQQLVQRDKADNRYRQYKHSLKVDSVNTSKNNPNQAQVEATVNELSQIYENGKLNQSSSYNENLRVRYNLIRQNSQWRIREMSVLN